nr:hypothetical protein [Tanacetum cinerariifolium]
MNIEGFDSDLMSKGRERHMEGEKKGDGWMWVGFNSGLMSKGRERHVERGKKEDGWIVNKLDHHLRPYHPTSPTTIATLFGITTIATSTGRPLYPAKTRLYLALSRVPNRSCPEYIWPRPGYPGPHSLSSQDPVISGLDPTISSLDPAILALRPTRLFWPRPDNISPGRGQDRQYPTKSRYICSRLGFAISDKDLVISAAKTSGLDLTISDQDPASMYPDRPDYSGIR